ncbi:TetR/AcrR family transcriptional regulator [Halococcus salifodinae]|nr:TetR/AcrR family transcriptional regulator [Halococcus salifodinae]
MNETETEIMEATYRALCEHGYASLRMQDIADETTKTKAALHYHYDTKHELLLAFLEFIHEEFVENLETIEGDDPVTRLRTYIHERLTPHDEQQHQRFQTALLEIKAQAPYDDAYHERLAEFDRRSYAFVHELLIEGIENGTVRSDIDAERVGEFFVTTINGAETRHVAINHPIEETRDFLLGYIDTTLLAEESPEVAAR